jgi:hypothetical protein
MISKALEKLAQKYGLSFREVMTREYIIYFTDSSIFGVLVRYDRDNERLSYSDDSYTMLDYALSFHENKYIRDCLKIVESFKMVEKTIKANIKIAKEYKVRNKIHQIEKDFK